MADYYDDKPTVLRKGRVSSKDARSTSAVNKAMATGNVEIHKKMSIYKVDNLNFCRYFWK